MTNTSLENRYMEFRLGDNHYAVPLLNVKEVIQKPEIVPVPNMPSYFEGMINLRGQILGVYNIRKRLTAKPRDSKDTAPEVIIVIENESISVGMIVDEVTRVLHPSEDMVQAAPVKDSGPAKRFIGSVIKTDKDLVMTINVTHLLDFEKLGQQPSVA